MAKKLTAREVIERMQNTHGGAYDYSQVEYINARTPVLIQCRACSDVFTQTTNNHINGHGCNSCGVQRRSSKKRKSLRTFIREASAIHGDSYGYGSVVYVNTDTPVKLWCNACANYFNKSPAHLLEGSGCVVCSNKTCGEKQRHTDAEFLKQARMAHGSNYTYVSGYTGSKDKMRLQCNKCSHMFTQTPENHLQGKGCPKCSHNVSKGETEIADWVRSLGFTVKCSVRGLTGTRSEVDILVEDRRVAIEFNGNHWHSTRSGRGRSYHVTKHTGAAASGYRLIMIRDDEWRTKKTIVMSILRHALGKTARRVHARKCEVVTVTRKEFNVFAEENHIQGSCSISRTLGLRYKGELVGCCAWVKRIDKWELVRFVVKNNTVVCGGFSRLVKAFGFEFHTFCERRLFGGAGYSTSGGVFQHTTPPDLSYTNGTIVMNRRRFQKKVAVKWMDTYDMLLTEKVNAENNGWYQLWGCGLDKYVFNA